MSTTLASSITAAASKQTYYTIRWLVDRERVDDAYRAYGYFRWVDDVLDADSGSPSDRRAFLARQQSRLERCFRGEAPRPADAQEEMLLDLVRRDKEKNSGLHAYLRYMMLVMAFDTQRRGRLITQVELDQYTRWLAIAVTEALHHFIGHGAFAPRDERRYRAVAAAHITHMLRDTFDDLQAGYYNVPREILDAQHIGPQDVHNDGYRAWVRGRVRLARDDFKAGSGYFARVPSWRFRLAGLAYTARFAWLLDTIERDDYCLRPQYVEKNSVGTGLRMSWRILSSMIQGRRLGTPRPTAVSRPLGRL